MTIGDIMCHGYCMHLRSSLSLVCVYPRATDDRSIGITVLICLKKQATSKAVVLTQIGHTNVLARLMYVCMPMVAMVTVEPLICGSTSWLINKSFFC